MRYWMALALLTGCGQPVDTTQPPMMEGRPADPSLSLAPPAQGEQVVIGPFNVPPGAEVQLCRTLKLSNTEEVGVNRLQVAMSHGSHHFILFRSDQDFPDQIFPCWGTVNFDDWQFIEDVNKSGGNDWTIADGNGFVFKPHQQIMVQSHFVNATTVQSPYGGMALLNIYEVPKSQIAHQLHGMFTVDTNINIPPHSSYSTHRTCTFSDTVYLAAMTGHFHARGKTFSVWRNRDQQNEEMLYQSQSWDSPPFEVFPSTTEVFNALDDGVQFQCDFFNPTDNWIGWGGHADVQEHCNLFFQYYFFDGNDNKPGLTCTQGTGGW